MLKKPALKSTLLVSLFLGAFVASAHGQTNTLNLTAKLRDFIEINNTGVGPTHPDFNNDAFLDCGVGPGPDDGVQGFVNTSIGVGAVDPNFPGDDRNPILARTTRPSDNHPCFTGSTRFNQWFNDDPAVNRKFKQNLVFTRVGVTNVFRFSDNSYFPLDNNTSVRQYTKFSSTDPDPYGILQSGFSPGGFDISKNNFGFTMEFHANFKYEQGTHQEFTFTGDDDVWVFINGKLVIDIGGLHSKITKKIDLDDKSLLGLGLVDGNNYKLDFFFAERHVSASNCVISTSLDLVDIPQVPTPVANPPGGTFNSQVFVSLSTSPADAIIYYTTNGKEPDSTSPKYTGPIAINTNIVLKAIAYKAGWKKSEVMTQTYNKRFSLSTLEILDPNGDPLPGTGPSSSGYLTEKMTSYTIRVNTFQAGLDTINPLAATKIAGDLDTLALTNPESNGEQLIYTGKVNFSIATKNIANGKTEASGYDTLIARWLNPKDGKDSAVKKVLVRPSPVQARAFFSHNITGTDTVVEYAGTETEIFVIIVDQVLPAGMQPKVTLVSYQDAGTKDTEILNLTPVTGQPGKYSVKVTVVPNGTVASKDGKLQLILDDEIRATYEDPVDTAETPAVANAGYGTAPENDGKLQFTDKSGNVLPNGVNYSPDEDSLYLRYYDDFVGAKTTKSVMLTIVNKDNAAPADTESFNLNLIPSGTVNNVGLWKGSIALTDILPILPGDHKANVYVKGLAHAEVISHSKAGDPSLIAFNELTVAYDDESTVIKVKPSPDTNLTVTRVTEGIIIKVKEQSLSSGTDTLNVTLSCSQSGDILVVKVVEVSPGVYESKVVPKSEGAKNTSDGTITCSDKDELKVKVTDPVYPTGGEITLILNDPLATRIVYTASANDSTPIKAVFENSANSTFFAIITARDKDLNTAESIPVTFTTLQGEKATFMAKETGNHTQTFVAEVPFKFINGNPDPTNSILEGGLLAKEVANRITATGTVTVDGNETKEDIFLVAAYVPVVKAYIKDENGDGAGDKVIIVFEKKLVRLPSMVEAQWNTSASLFTPATGGKISFLGADSSVVAIDYSDNPFPRYLTSATASDSARAKLPTNDALFNSQKPGIQDSIGPVIVSALKIPANVNALKPGDPGFNIDTLLITLSEPLKTTGDFNQVLKFSSICSDYENAITINAYKDPTIENGTKYTILVDNSGKVPLAGNCVFLNSDGPYTDLMTNLPSKAGVKLDGGDRPRIIQLFRGFPPVAGLEASTTKYQVAVQDSRDSSTGYALSGNRIEWVAPVGFVDGKKFVSYIPNSPKDTVTNKSDNLPLSDFPITWSAIQVISTTKYVANVTIFDNLGNFVVSFKQSFGYQGELGNPARVVRKGLASWLVWDQKDKDGQIAGQGVYVWKVVFTFETGKQEIQFTRTGIMRK